MVRSARKWFKVRMRRVAPIVFVAALWGAAPSEASAETPSPRPAAIERDLEIARPGAAPQRLGLAAALRTLPVPTVGIALIDKSRLAWARSYGAGVSVTTQYQAASLSKLVTAVAALRLVEQGKLALDRNVNDDLRGWRVPDSELTREHPVTLRGLLSMTAGIGVPGYLGYTPGAPLPSLTDILDGKPPANSPPVRVVAVPGSAYAYSGGGYEIVQALIEAKTGKPFAAAMQDLLLKPAGMKNSSFTQPPSKSLARRAATGHDDDGRELPGGWRIIPELAAGGLWSTPADLARFLVALARANGGKRNPLLRQAMAREMMTRQNNGPYGLGGAVAGSGQSLVLMKRGQNVGYQAYMLIFPESGQGIVVMTRSDNGTTLATALIRRAAAVYRWPPLGELAD
jgi:CubicO group peptidase (beta-lactamase class C family)